MKNSKPASFESAVNYLAIGKALLESPKYLSVKNEYDLTRKKLKNNMAWYSLFNGPRNLKDLAEKLNHYVLYDVFFKNYSASTHGVDIIQGKLRGGSNENLGILQLRNPANAQDIVYNCFNFCLLVYSNFLQTKLPEKQKEYDEWLKSIREIRVKLVSNKFISPINGC